MAFSQRARAYTLNPTLPCPTLPLSPCALSDSSIIPAAGRLCLKFKRKGSDQCFVLFCFVLFGLQLSVCLWWLQVPLRILSDV